MRARVEDVDEVARKSTRQMVPRPGKVLSHLARILLLFPKLKTIIFQFVLLRPRQKRRGFGARGRYFCT